MIQTIESIKNNTVYTADVNYGTMSWYLIDGRLCCTERMDVVRDATTAAVVEHSEMKVGDTFYEATIQCMDYWAPPGFYARNKSEVLEIARSLSKGGLSTSVLIHARIVARFKDGKLIGEIKTLDEFYTNLSEDEVNDTDLTETLSE